MVTRAEVKTQIEASGENFIGIKEWKNHDWILWNNPPNVTYGRLILDCHIADLPQSSLEALFPSRKVV